ncbi:MULTISPECIES: nickel pincer cofactor biosynthesis protein LarB [Dermabacter]|uniref:nickel pincer cofactor biosynthesis protein LarB n=1 Tax=Dermabacter TaxID=36739 RepID=UPI000C76C650|nr:nickel pincer cofactor biosynthesis protein LarB [Dermabacter sp.]MDU4923306.1 nickel pincer cofactor biosynthesis protein LarB [Dermabacter sp.]WIK61578.1 nickel pincer cofactor biosynthesis protein LarB [Dermabacter hominis]
MSAHKGADASLASIANLDFDRASRRGAPEAILCDAKSTDQLVRIARAIRERARDTGTAPTLATLFTRLDTDKAAELGEELPGFFFDEEASIGAWPASEPTPTGGLVTIACAGTSDLPVAREAELTARYLGRPTRLIPDIGIAGLHRLLERLPELRESACIIAVAGMDGALPTVIAGQVACPVVALPTSVGYGVAAGGISAALTMLSACAPGIGVVNIDNGYGAGHLAAQIARWAPRDTE